MSELFFVNKNQFRGAGGLTQQRAGARPCAAEALLRLDLLVLLGQAKRTEKEFKK